MLQTQEPSRVARDPALGIRVCFGFRSHDFGFAVGRWTGLLTASERMWRPNPQWS